MEIAKGPDWDLRLHRNGRFALRINKNTRFYAEGEETHAHNGASGENLPDLFGQIFYTVRPDQLVELHQALLSIPEEVQSQAKKLQREYRGKLAKARQAVLAQRSDVDLQEALSELRQLAQGGAA